MIPTATAAPDDPCNGIWYNTYDAGVVTVGTNLNPGCTHVNVYIPSLRQCVTEGEPEHVATVGNVKVWQETCA